MAHLVAQHPEIHLTINFSPVLLWQLEDYLERGGSDRALLLTRKPTGRLTSAERRELIETFFDAHWHHQIYPHPRYRKLLDQRVRGGRFSVQDLTDLKMWFTLAWFAHEFRSGVVTLPDGSTASVRRFVEKGEGFTQDDIEAMLAEQEKVLRNIVLLHRQLQDQGQIEVSMTPYFHPILPLLMDTDRATLDRAGTAYPARFAYPEDAEAHVAGMVTFYRERFGRELRGMWPAEGAVAEAIVPILVRHGVQWIATDEGVLARSGYYGYRVEDPNVLCQPYRVLPPTGAGGVSVIFRHRQLSDAIGFHYQTVPEPERAAQSFVAGIKEIARGLKGERDGLLPVILDGENAWGSYRDDGRPFLHALYQMLASDAEIKTVTVSEYVEGNAARRLPAHVASEQTRVYNLFTGSWIDEFGSAPGMDLGTWVGEPEENEAWRLLGEVRHALEKAGATPASRPEAYRALYAAEGSDWFWWYGSDHQSDADEAFDDLFRNHLKAACRLAGVEASAGLDRHIVPHRVIWTFTAPVSQIQPGDRLTIRTNCPGTLAWSIDGWGSVTESPLVPTGGVMAGPCHHAVTLGPFPSGTSLAFRFRCQHPGCAGETVCCRGEEWTVNIPGES
jgi:alpha-amylase/alpha-mannosidase (GH57 family)